MSGTRVRDDAATIGSGITVVGAGVGGLALAVALRRAQISVTVIERRSDPREIESGGGFILWNNAMKALRSLGLAEKVLAAGSSLHRLEWRSSGNRCLAEWPLDRIGNDVGESALGIRRNVLQSILTEAVGPGVLRLGEVYQRFDQRVDSRVDVHLASGESLRTGALVGADGINSRVRAQLQGGARAPRYAGVHQSFGITDYTLDNSAIDTFLELVGPGLRFFVFPVGNGQTYWAAACRASHRPSIGAERPAVEKDRLLSRFAGWPPPVEALIRATDPAAIYRRDIVDRYPIRAWGCGSVTLLGDAAHPLTPNLGQGACQAIEDAAVLGRYLSDGTDVGGALRGYETSRRSRTSSFVLRSRLIGSMGRWQSPVACRVREHFIRTIVAGPALRRHAADMAYEF
jgi:2-polyprenyl-6-methoxyphenol hydroxylase-like FAD-dependent oxidoreductase